MIPKECKRLAEVDFPIAEVSKHSAREKSIRHGHPSTLHLWWARRPLAACRAMLLGLLLPDPCDTHCPDDFREKARRLLPEVQGQIGTKNEDLRHALLQFIGDFANWDLSTNRKYLEVSRSLVKAAHPEETPLVVDPFAGGGSIPLEALRLGCETFASDLNPVACLILKVMLEDIPRHGPELAEELRRIGTKIKQEAEKELAEFYPADSDGSRPIVYLWARTVRCETPNCGAEIPLVRSFWLSKKAGRRHALRYKVIKNKEINPYIEFEIFKLEKDIEVPNGTVTRAKATCPCCNVVLSPDRVRAQLREQRGGADVIFDKKGNRIGVAKLLAVVTLKPSIQGRCYRSIGAGYIDRNWPPALKESGAWSLTSLRQSFLNGSLTRLLDPDAILRSKIVEFVGNCDFGLASGQKPDGAYERVWYMELISPEEVAFESGVFLLKKDRAKSLKAGIEPRPSPEPPIKPFPQPEPIPDHEPDVKTIVERQTCTLRLAGAIPPPEVWNRLGTKILPKLRSGTELQIGVDFRVTLKSDIAQSIKSELRQILDDMGLTGKVVIEES